MPARSLIFALTFAAILVTAITVMLQVSVTPIRAETPGVLLTATATVTATPTQTPNPMVYTTTVFLTPSTTSVVAGQLLTVTTDLVVTGTCSFSTYDITLGQEPHPLFAYIDPPTNVIRPWDSRTWRLSAMQTGVVTFTVAYYGEIYCGFYQWHYVRGESKPVTVTGYLQALPTVGRSGP